MAITTYTDYDTIRAVLGVSAKEIKDVTLGLSMFETQFLLEMSDVDNGVGAVLTNYTTWLALGAGATADQKRFISIVNLMASYSVALQILTGMPLASPQQITDGQATLQRFNDHVFDRVRSGVTQTYTGMLARLKSLLLKLVPTAQVVPTPARTYIGSVSTGTDPITGV